MTLTGRRGGHVNTAAESGEKGWALNIPSLKSTGKITCKLPIFSTHRNAPKIGLHLTKIEPSA